MFSLIYSIPWARASSYLEGFLIVASLRPSFLWRLGLKVLDTADHLSQLHLHLHLLSAQPLRSVVNFGQRGSCSCLLVFMDRVADSSESYTPVCPRPRDVQRYETLTCAKKIRC